MISGLKVFKTPHYWKDFSAWNLRALFVLVFLEGGGGGGGWREQCRGQGLFSKFCSRMTDDSYL